MFLWWPVLISRLGFVSRNLVRAILQQVTWYELLAHACPFKEKPGNLFIFVKLLRVHLIHFCIIRRQQVRKCFRLHVGYLETFQHCASLLLRSLSYHLSLSTLPIQGRQLCIGKTVTFFTVTRSTREIQSSCNPISLKRAVEYLVCISEWQTKFDRKALQSLWGCVCVCIY